jgi:hypothetical protein
MHFVRSSGEHVAPRIEAAHNQNEENAAEYNVSAQSDAGSYAFIADTQNVIVDFV